MDIGKRLRELREAKGLTQRGVEGRSGLNVGHISKIENGRHAPSFTVLERWAKALDVDLHDIFAPGDGKPEVPAPELGGTPVDAQERTLLRLFDRMHVEDKALMISFARDLVKRQH